MKLVFFCLLVLIFSALVTVFGIQLTKTSGGDPTRLSGQFMLAAAMIGAALILRKDFSTNRVLVSALLLLAAATGIALGFGLYLLALIGTCIMVAAITIPGYTEFSLPVTVVCKLENAELVRQLFGHKSLLVAFDKTLGSDLVELTVQAQMTPADCAILLQRVRAYPAVMELRCQPAEVRKRRFKFN